MTFCQKLQHQSQSFKKEAELGEVLPINFVGIALPGHILGL